MYIKKTQGLSHGRHGPQESQVWPDTPGRCSCSATAQTKSPQLQGCSTPNVFGTMGGPKNSLMSTPDETKPWFINYGGTPI